MTLSKSEVVAAIAARRKETRTVAVPEWGGDILIRRLSAGDLDATGMMSGLDDSEQILKALALSIVADTGDPYFTLEEIRTLDDVDAVVTLKLFVEVAKLNGMSTPELEEMVAGFDAAQPDDSSSD